MQPFAGAVFAEEQLREVGEMMEDFRSASGVCFADFAEKLAAGEVSELKTASVAPGERGSHR